MTNKTQANPAKTVFLRCHSSQFQVWTPGAMYISAFRDYLSRTIEDDSRLLDGQWVVHCGGQDATHQWFFICDGERDAFFTLPLSGDSIINSAPAGTLFGGLKIS